MSAAALARKARRLLPALLLCPLAPASAAWQLQLATPAAEFFVDDASLQALSGSRRVWVLQELRVPDARGVRSLRSFVEFDCRGARQRVIEQTAFAGPRAGGAVVGIGAAAPDWADVAPGSPAAALLRWACAGR